MTLGVGLSIKHCNCRAANMPNVWAEQVCCLANSYMLNFCFSKDIYRNNYWAPGSQCQVPISSYVCKRLEKAKPREIKGGNIYVISMNLKFYCLLTLRP